MIAQLAVCGGGRKKSPRTTDPGDDIETGESVIRALSACSAFIFRNNAAIRLELGRKECKVTIEILFRNVRVRCNAPQRRQC
jgi:hypothetical protein